MKGTVLNRITRFVWANIMWFIIGLYQYYVMDLSPMTFIGLCVILMVHGVRSYGAGLYRGLYMAQKAMHAMVGELNEMFKK